MWFWNQTIDKWVTKSEKSYFRVKRIKTQFFYFVNIIEWRTQWFKKIKIGCDKVFEIQNQNLILRKMGLKFGN